MPSEWKFWTWNDYYHECRLFAKALIKLDVQAHHVTNIIGFNSPEWFLSLVGSLMAGCIGAGIYSTNGPEACYYIIKHSHAEILALENNKQLAKFVNLSLPCLKAIVIWEEHANPALAAAVGKPVYHWQDFLTLGNDVTDVVLDARCEAIQPGHCASLIYTSGTTGPPKSVMISHDNITWTAANMVESYTDLDHHGRIVSYLPLSHIAGQLIDIYLVMKGAACSYFAQPDALKGTLTVTMKDVHPTFFFGVPRVWEKIQEKMVSLGRQSSGIKAYLSSLAKAFGAEKSRLAQFGQPGGVPWGYGCANSLVLSKVKEALGLDKCSACFTGAAPIPIETLMYFASLDIPVYEVFGQSECTGPHTVCAAKAWKLGTCGRPMHGTITKIGENEELCYTGRHVFMGYMYMPKETAEAIDDQGYLHSGDVGEFDENHEFPQQSGLSSFMKVTGRIKELLITTGGENIPPVLIEKEMKAAMPAVSNVIVIGDNCKYLTMMVSLKVTVDLDTGMPTDQLAPDTLYEGEKVGATVTTYSEAKTDAIWRAYVDKGMKAGNLHATSTAQIVQKWIWLPIDFTEKNGELTPTLKLKRKVVTEHYKGLIDGMYAEHSL